MKLIKMPSIDQFRGVVANVNRTHTFVGLDDQGEAIYDHSIPKPTLKFTGTIKLHGTCASACFNETDGIWAQSKDNIITPQKDNAGFAFFVESKKEAFKGIFEKIKEKYGIDTKENTISIFGEWCGPSIQKGVSISQMPEKTMFIFGIKISNNFDAEVASYWANCNEFNDNDNRIFNIHDFKTYEIDIDFNTPQLSQNKIIEYTIEVENQCPVGMHFGIDGIGEGIVFSAMNPDGRSRLIFKSKGEKHSNSKVRTLKHVDNEKINKIIDVAEKVTPAWRLEQMMTETFDLNNGGVIERNKLGEYIKRVIADVIKEDMDILVENGLEIKDLGKYISDISRTYFFEQERNNLGV